MTRTPCSSATRLRLKSLVRMTRLRARASATSLASTSVTSGTSSSTISTGVAGLLLHPVEDLEAAPAAVAPERVRAVGDVLQLVEHEPRDDERAVDEAGLDDLGDPAVDDRARVDDDARFAARALGRLAGRRPTDEARPPRRRSAGRAAWRRSGRACRGRGRSRRRAAARSRTAGRAWTAAARAAGPSAGPSSRPTTAVTNSAVDRSSTCRISQVAGTTVRYGRIAKPTTIQATTQAARRAPAYCGSRKSPSPEPASPSPTRLPSAAPRRRM